MKKILILIVPAALLAVVVGFVLAPAQVNASPIPGPVSHTHTRSCGDHCHHHGHTWRSGGCTYWCPGHR